MVADAQPLPASQYQFESGIRVGGGRRRGFQQRELRHLTVNVRATAGLAGGGRPAYSVDMGVVSAVEWMPVESGLFSSTAYRARERQLYLRFHDGKIYRFFDCPVTVYNEFVAAASKARYFSQQIRSHFRYEMVRRVSS